MSIVLKNCKFIVTQDKNREILENLDILIEDNVIKQIGHDLSGEIIINAKNRIVMPGLINLHTHSPMQFLRGSADDLPLKQWLEEKIWPSEAKLNKKIVKNSTKNSIKEMIYSGTTAFNDMYFFQDISADLAKKIGIRMYLGEGILDFQSPSSKNPQETIKKTIIYLNKHKDNDLIKIVFAPHSIYTCSKDILKEVKKLADENNLLIHIHLSETKKEVEDSIEKYKLSPVEFLDSINFLGENVIAAHCCHLSDKDIEILAKNKVNIAYCPTSNMKLASGVLPYKKLKVSKINIGLGTDSSVSNNNLDMFEEMKIASLLQKINELDPALLNAQEALDIATINGSIALKLNSGSIEIGKLADIILLDSKNILLQPLTKETLISNIIYSANGSCVKEVIINGKVIKK
jgi:5-methylthioadenosine/S-adenosylhomocysteine deaminase